MDRAMMNLACDLGHMALFTWLVGHTRRCMYMYTCKDSSSSNMDCTLHTVCVSPIIRINRIHDRHANKIECSLT
jgi:hypothetical protein